MRNLIISTALFTAFVMPNTAAVAQDAIAQGSDLQASATVTGQASTRSERVSTKTYQVSVDGKRRDNKSDVLDKALYKAAKKTLDKDYDWFRVVNRDTETIETRGRNNSGFSTTYERAPQRNCGLLGCSTTYETQSRSRFEADLSSRDETRHNITIEYEMGIGEVEDNEDVYDARIVKNSYR